MNENKFYFQIFLVFFSFLLDPLSLNSLNKCTFQKRLIRKNRIAK